VSSRASTSTPRPGAWGGGEAESGGGSAERHLIVWDGDCGFCRRAVEWALARDAAGLFEATPYQRVPSPPMTPELRAACRAAVHVRTADGRWLRGGRACLFVLERVGWPRLARVARVPPLVWAVELGYRIVAGNRRLFSRLTPRRSSAA
jgi:predicted DCC family thiol-disulfide oxidoreductase YuxK